MGIVKRLAGAGILAAAGAYFLNPDKGAERRAMLQERFNSLAGGGDEGGGGADSQSQPGPNDADLADRVESEAFRAADVPKGSVNVNAEMGIVYFRGTIESDEKRSALIAAAKRIEGVRAVEDLLHAPGEPAEAKEETEEETRRRVEENPVRSQSSSSQDGD